MLGSSVQKRVGSREKVENSSKCDFMLMWNDNIRNFDSYRYFSTPNMEQTVWEY